MFLIPLYYEVNSGASSGEAGAYLLPSIIGNTVGGLTAGLAVKKYGRTKLLLITAAKSSMLCFSLLLHFWNGNAPVWQSLLIFPGGFATGVIYTVSFVIVAAGVDETEMAIAGSGLYLSGSVGAVAGLSGTSVLFQTTLRSNLYRALRKDGIKDFETVSSHSGCF